MIFYYVYGVKMFFKGPIKLGCSPGQVSFYRKLVTCRIDDLRLSCNY